jgi:hypothetical protein
MWRNEEGKENTGEKKSVFKGVTSLHGVQVKQVMERNAQ